MTQELCDHLLLAYSVDQPEWTVAALSILKMQTRKMLFFLTQVTMVHASGANITYLKATEEPHTNCRNFSLPSTKHRRIFQVGAQLPMRFLAAGVSKNQMIAHLRQKPSRKRKICNFKH